MVFIMSADFLSQKSTADGQTVLAARMTPLRRRWRRRWEGKVKRERGRLRSKLLESMFLVWLWVKNTGYLKNIKKPIGKRKTKKCGPQGFSFGPIAIIYFFVASMVL